MLAVASGAPLSSETRVRAALPGSKAAGRRAVGAARAPHLSRQPPGEAEPSRHREQTCVTPTSLWRDLER